MAYKSLTKIEGKNIFSLQELAELTLERRTISYENKENHSLVHLSYIKGLFSKMLFIDVEKMLFGELISSLSQLHLLTFNVHRDYLPKPENIPSDQCLSQRVDDSPTKRTYCVSVGTLHEKGRIKQKVSLPLFTLN